ncbi:TetR family transcriptional regulator [Microbacterium sp. ProA8]|jgi:AcrR family transcriptional regulator|uniref:TetR/AcrR family transcriptional regulator n=1 Tax=Microbacterium chionoecetis TaxID=3153754 RepID=UPI00326721E9
MSPRADAVRSRERILEVARGRDARTLRLNDIAGDAGVGIGTVYRHFPTVRALIEALSVETLMRLGAAADRAVAAPDAHAAFRGFLEDALTLQLQDSGLETVLTDLALTDADLHDECAIARGKVFSGYDAVLSRAQRDGVVRRDLSVAQLQRLICGLEHAVRLGAPADRDLLLDILLSGMRPAALDSPAAAIG